ncbi:MAG TPA: hypothetical protein VFF65_12920 [Phycisphaerales bacterium]|nr:hypothetical protein [Phycisphaerales bacterium]
MPYRGEADTRLLELARKHLYLYPAGASGYRIEGWEAFAASLRARPAEAGTSPHTVACKTCGFVLNVGCPECDYYGTNHGEAVRRRTLWSICELAGGNPDDEGWDTEDAIADRIRRAGTSPPEYAMVGLSREEREAFARRWAGTSPAPSETAACPTCGGPISRAGDAGFPSTSGVSD